MAEMAQLLLPDDTSIEILSEQIQEENLFYVLKVDSSSAQCPLCSTLSTRSHSWYTRNIKDKPQGNRSVSLQIYVHKWFCDSPNCPREIFTERLSWLKPHRRSTDRMEQALIEIALTTNCLAAEKLCRTLAYPVSHDTLLRLIRKIEPTDERCSPFRGD
jgi:transposase